MTVLKRFFLILKGDPLALLSVLILTFWLALAMASFVYEPWQDIPMTLSQRLKPPSQNAWMGFDSGGQSVALLLIHGARTSLLVSSVTVALCLLLGVPFGAVAGYFGGWTDTILSRLMDILLAFPPLILPIAIMAFFGAGLVNVVLALSLTGWVSYARLVRGQFQSWKERDFVTAARSLGAHHGRIMFRHILPNTVSPLVVQATFALAGVIISEAGLSFLGLGVSSQNPSWGALLNDGRTYLLQAPHMTVFPALALFSVVASLNFLGEALRLAFDPRSSGAGGVT